VFSIRSRARSPSDVLGTHRIVDDPETGGRSSASQFSQCSSFHFQQGGGVSEGLAKKKKKRCACREEPVLDLLRVELDPSERVRGWL